MSEIVRDYVKPLAKEAFFPIKPATRALLEALKQMLGDAQSLRYWRQRRDESIDRTAALNPPPLVRLLARLV